MQYHRVRFSDVCSVPCLAGTADQNVEKILNRYRVVVGLKANHVRPDDKEYADSVALQHLALLDEGGGLTLFQQIMTDHH